MNFTLITSNRGTPLVSYLNSQYVLVSKGGNRSSLINGAEKGENYVISKEKLQVHFHLPGRKSDVRMLIKKPERRDMDMYYPTKKVQLAQYLVFILIQETTLVYMMDL